MLSAKVDNPRLRVNSQGRRLKVSGIEVVAAADAYINVEAGIGKKRDTGDDFAEDFDPRSGVPLSA